MIPDALYRLGERHGSPIVIINTAHSGSRLLAQVLVEAGVYMGCNLNESLDCLEIVPLVEHLICTASWGVPSAAELDDPISLQLAAVHLQQHLKDAEPGTRWGWKLCETLLIVPFIHRLFPGTTFIHLVRDGRDVALCPFVAPKAPFWRKVYFGTDEIESWRGYAMTQRAYRSSSAIFNAQRWRYHVDLARTFGALLGERYIEVRYEDLVMNYSETVRKLCLRLALSTSCTSQADPEQVYASSIGKWKTLSRLELNSLLSILEPTLSGYGYSDGRIIPPARNARPVERIAFHDYLRRFQAQYLKKALGRE